MYHHPRTRRPAALLAIALVPLALAAAACGDDAADAAGGPTVTTTAGTTAGTAHTGDSGHVPDADGPTTTAAPAGPTVIDVVTTDFSFEMPDMGPFPAGMVTLELTNEGSEDHQVHLARLHDGVTMSDIDAAIAAGDEAGLFTLIDFMGGSNTVPTGGVQVTQSELTEGTYVMICFIPSPDGVPHFAKGMIMPFEVVEGSGAVSVPEVDGTIVARDFAIELPADLGTGTYELVNEGKEPHEVTIVRINDGLTFDDVMSWYVSGAAGAPPFSSAGGLGVIRPGGTMYGELDLEPGNYAALCFVPGQGGTPHVAMGMFQPFTVS